MNHILEGDYVRVYWNLHKQCYSVQTRQKKGWRVTAHVDKACLDDPRFTVSAAGNARVRREQRKNVHAYVTGHWTYGTPSPRWTIADQIGHLTYFDWTAALAITDPDQFTSLTAELMGAMTSENEDMFPVTYNPYRYTEFQDTLLDKPIHHARRAFLTTDRKIWAWQ